MRDFVFNIVLLLSMPVRALQRTVGNKPAQDTVQSCLDQSNSTLPIGFGYGQCGLLIRCVITNLPADQSAGMQAGGNIASLVPTILALVGAPPLDLVQLAFMSPHRAIATCMFGIGLPSGLFRQLQVRLPRLADKKTSEPKLREWVLPLPRSKSKGRLRLVKTVVVDVITIALAGVMLWRNTVVCFQTMVTWRCEYSWLLICWPIACVAWLLIAVSFLHVLAQKIEITFSEDSPGTRRSRLDLLLLPYRTPPAIRKARHAGGKEVPASPIVKVEPNESAATKTTVAEVQARARSLSAHNISDSHFVIAITMRYESSWGWFEATIETLAVGIYLYATFILTSSLFLSGEQAIIYASVMILSLGAIRISEAL